MAGKLYGIGVGPGDTGLMTLRAKEVLEGCGVIAYPVKRPGEGSVALDIIKPVVDISEKSIEEFLFSMDPDDSVRERCRAEALDKMCMLLDNGEDIAMVTLGDVGVYSTYMYIDRDIRARGYETEVIPGIPSFCHGAALAGIPLMIGNEGLAGRQQRRHGGRVRRPDGPRQGLRLLHHGHYQEEGVTSHDFIHWCGSR